MNLLHSYFPPRVENDDTDIVPILRHELGQQPDRIVFSFEGKSVNRRTLQKRVGALQRWLVDQGLEKGDHVAVMLANSSDHVALIYAIVLSGLVWVPVNTRLRSAGLQYQLGHARPKILITEPAFEEAIEQAAVAGVPCATLEEIVSAAGESGSILGVDIRHTDPLCLIYTSGTTGAPKGVVFTHRMMRIASEAVLRVANVQAGSRMFLWEPLCHIGGAQMLMVPFLADTELYFVGKFSASRFWQQWNESKSTHLHYLGGVLDILAQTPVPEGAGISVAWGAGVAASSWGDIRERLRCQIRECYGMTECSSFATLNESGKPGSIGRALPWIRIELLDNEGRVVAPGEIGEIVLSSDVEGVFLPCYLDNPDATERTIGDGRLRTGDNARRDLDGDYFFVGRKTDSMRVRGENVSAWEVERVFADHPAIHSSAAIGVDSVVGEQEIMIYVRFNDGQTVDWDALVTWARPRLAVYQLPMYYQAIDCFELTPSERVRKHRLSRDLGNSWRRSS